MSFMNNAIINVAERKEEVKRIDYAPSAITNLMDISCSDKENLIGINSLLTKKNYYESRLTN